MDSVIQIATAIAVVAGFYIYAKQRAKLTALLTEKIRQELTKSGQLTLPELVTRAGLKDGFANRGKVLSALHQMQTRGEVVQEKEPPGTTARNRLEVMSFRLVQAKPPSP